MTAASHSSPALSSRGAVIAGILVLIVTSAALAWVRTGDGQSSSGTIDQTWVNQKLVEWKPQSTPPILSGGLMERASYDNILLSYNTPDVQSANLAMLVATNASSVRIDIGYDAWLQNNAAAQSELASIVSQIRADGKTFVLADAAAESYRHGGQIPWTQFKQAWIDRVTVLATTFHPDYYIVVKEPGWYAPMISDVTTNPAVQSPSEWLNLTASLAAVVHASSPNTVVGVAIAADSLGNSPSLYVPYLTGLSGLSGVSFMGFDLYTTTGYDLTLNFLNQHGSGGKSVWIAECWSGDGSQIYDSSRSTLDANWMWAAFYFGYYIHAQMVMPFYTDLFSSYTLTGSSPTSSSQIISLYGQRTPVFTSFSEAAAGGTGPTNTQTGSTTVTSSTGSSQTSQTSQTTSSASETGSTTTSTSGGARGNTILYLAAVVVVVVIAIAAVALTRRRR